jgi:hypothetical protein
MKRRIWLRSGSRAAKAVWVTETDQGLYIGPSVDLKIVHFSYHQDGQRHLTNAGGKHFNPSDGKDRPLHSISDHGNVGGFSVEPSKLEWQERSTFRKDDVVIDCDVATRSDLPLLVSLHVCERSRVASLTEAIRSLGPTCRDTCVSFDLPLYPTLNGIIHIQYNTHG